MPNIRRGMMAAAGAGAAGAANTPFTQYYYGGWAHSNSKGTLGQGNTTGISSPIQIGDHKWQYLEGGPLANDHCIGVKPDGSLWTWGDNSKGQLGVGNTTDYSSPVQVGSLTTWLQIGLQSDAGSFAVKTDGTLWAWGFGEAGRLGDGTTVDKSSPIQIGSLTDWGDGAFSIENNNRIADGRTTTHVIKTDGTLWAWGEQDAYKQLGDGTAINRSSPVQIGSDTWLMVKGGGSFWIGINTAGELWGCGENDRGMLGDGTTTNRSTPVQAGSATDWVDIGVGWNWGSAINSSGELYTWGDNRTGALGQGNLTSLSVPTQVGSLTDWKYLGSSDDSLYAVKTDGTLWWWGGAGRSPNSEVVAKSSPVQVGSDTDWTFPKELGGGGFVGNSSTI